MPQLKIKTEYLNRLKELGVYEKWFENVKLQWYDSRTKYISESKYFMEMCTSSFVYADTPEGHDFWYEISIK